MIPTNSNKSARVNLVALAMTSIDTSLSPKQVLAFVKCARIMSLCDPV